MRTWSSSDSLNLPKEETYSQPRIQKRNPGIMRRCLLAERSSQKKTSHFEASVRAAGQRLYFHVEVLEYTVSAWGGVLFGRKRALGKTTFAVKTLSTTELRCPTWRLLKSCPCSACFDVLVEGACGYARISLVSERNMDLD